MISNSRKQGGKLFTGGLDFDDFFNFDNIGDSLSGFYEGTFLYKDPNDDSKKATAIVLHECECEKYDNSLKLMSDECKSKLAIQLTEQQKMIISQALRKIGIEEFKSNHILTFVFEEEKDTGKKNPMKKFSLYVSTGERTNQEDLPF